MKKTSGLTPIDVINELSPKRVHHMFVSVFGKPVFKNLNAIEIAISYNRLIEECQLTQDQLSDKIGKNRTTISNYIRPQFYD